MQWHPETRTLRWPEAVADRLCDHVFAAAAAATAAATAVVSLLLALALLLLLFINLLLDPCQCDAFLSSTASKRNEV